MLPAGSLEAEVEPPLPGYRLATSWMLYTTSCNTQSSAPEDGWNYCPKHVLLIGVINKPLLLHLVGCLYYLYQCCMVKQTSYIPIYFTSLQSHLSWLILSSVPCFRPLWTGNISDIFTLYCLWTGNLNLLVLWWFWPHFNSGYVVCTEWHKKTGTFEKPNKNWRNPRKKKLLTEIEPLQLAF